MTRYTYPPAQQQAVSDNYHDTTVSDPYRWLEDPAAPETIAFVAAQNQFTRDFLDEIPGSAALHSRLTELWDYPKFGPPVRRGDYTIFAHNDGLQNQPVLYKQHAASAEPEPLLDPNTLSEDGTVALMNYFPSQDGRRLAYSLATHGSDWQEIRIRDVATGTDLPDLLQWVKFTPVAWLPDSSGFLYGRYPETGEFPDAPPSTHHRLYLHLLGAEQSQDQLIYARPDDPELAFAPTISEDGAYLLLHVWSGTAVQNRVYYCPLKTGEGTSPYDFVRLIDQPDASYDYIGNYGTRLFFHTDLEAPLGRVIAIDLRRPARDHWTEVIAESSDTLDQVSLVNNQFVLLYLHRACHRLLLADLAGAPAGEIPLPALGTITALTGKQADRELHFEFQSYLYPPNIYRYKFDNSPPTSLHEIRADFQREKYQTQQHWYKSADGVQVSLFLTGALPDRRHPAGTEPTNETTAPGQSTNLSDRRHPAGTKPTNEAKVPAQSTALSDRRHPAGTEPTGYRPTILYGYGGFALNRTPLFSPFWIAWLEQGGLLAEANLRGGNEYGEEWHVAGMLQNKQNVFDDFIAAAEWLIAEGYTNSDRLAIMGRSNGGLLVAACMLQRPELFGAVICYVPVIDMLRYHRFTAGRYWTSEYGNAETDPEHFRFLYAYSPLHNVRPGVTYPPTLILSADTDDRVVPMHAQKFAAALQANDSGANPILLRIDTRSGHGLGKPTAKLIAEFCDVLLFLQRTLLM